MKYLRRFPFSTFHISYSIFLWVAIFVGSCRQSIRFEALPRGSWSLGDIERNTPGSPPKDRKIYAASFDDDGNLHLIYNSRDKLRYLKKSPAETDFNRKTPTNVQWINFPVNPGTTKISLNIDREGRPHVIHSGPQGLRYHILHESGWILGLITDHAETTQPWQMLFNGRNIPMLVIEHHNEGIALMQPTTQGWSEELGIAKSEMGAARLACFNARMSLTGHIQIAYILQRDHWAQFWIKSQSTESITSSNPWMPRSPRGPVPWQTSKLLGSRPADQIEACRISWNIEGEPSCVWLSQEKNLSWRLEFTNVKKSKLQPALLAKGPAKTRPQTDFSYTTTLSGQSHILWRLTSEPWLYHLMRQADGQWQRSIINQETLFPENAVMALNKQGRPLIVFNDAHSNDLKYAWPKK